MKKFTLLFVLLVSNFIYSQTTLDEYNYMVKGYKIQVTSGLDPKAGYVVQDITTINKSDYTFKFKALLRSDDTLAGIIIVSHSNIWGNTYYIGLPVANLEFHQKYEAQISAWDEPMTTAYANALSEMYINSMDTFLKKMVEKNKK